MRTQTQGRPAPGVPEALPGGETPRWRRPAGAVGRWWLGPLPRARVAQLRTVIYLFIFVDVLATTSWVADHADVSGQLYQPVLVARVLSLPVPGPGLVRTVEIALLVAAAVAATGRLPRLAGATVFALYFEWMVIAFSYGKVDHDRFAFLVALAVLPTVGRVVRGDRCADEAAGWALRAVQVAVVATYLLAAVAKFRFGGLAWLNSATLAWAVVRRGTFVADPLAQVPWVLQIAQWGIVAFELASPLMLVRGRIGRAMLGTAIAFHVVTYATITIIFLPHMICLLAFIPLERLRRGGSGEAGHAGERRSLPRPPPKAAAVDGDPGGRSPPREFSTRRPGRLRRSCGAHQARRRTSGSPTTRTAAGTTAA